MKFVTRVFIFVILSLSLAPDFEPSSAQVGTSSLNFWDASSGRLLSISLSNSQVEDVTALAFSPDSQVLAVANATRTIDLWDLTANRKQVSFAGHKGAVQSLAFSPDGRMLASGSWDRTIKLWSIYSRKLVASVGQTAHVLSVAFSPDGKYLASGAGDAKVCLLNVATRKSQCRFAGHADQVNSVAFTPDSKLLATGSDDRTVKLWEIDTGKLLFTLEGHLDRVQTVAFNSRDKTLASGSSDKTIKIWDIINGGEISSWSGHLSSVDGLSFSADGKTLASGSYDRTVKLWDVSSGKELRSLERHAERVTAVVFSPDGRILVSGSALNRAPSPTLHVLAVGISNYYGRSIHVDFAAKDATDFATALEKTARTKFERISVRVLTDYSASEVAISAAVNKIINEAKPQDVFVLFFGGSATSSLDQNLDKEQFYLFGSDGGGISQVTLKSWLTRVEARQQLVVLQTKDSHRGYELFAKQLAEEARALKGLLKRDLVIVANAFQANPIPRLKNGFLAHTLLEGLAGRAAADNGELTVQGLGNYAKSKQSALSKSLMERTGRISTYEFGRDFQLGIMPKNQLSLPNTKRSSQSAPVVHPGNELFYPGERGGSELAAASAYSARQAVSVQQLRSHAFSQTSLIRSEDLAGATKPRNQILTMRTRDPSEPEITSTTVRLKSHGNVKRKDYALLIATNDYKNWPDLKSPISDAEKLAKELKAYYGFEIEIVKDPTADQVEEALLRYEQKQYSEFDQLFIFFAGHGTYIQRAGQGFLVFSDSASSLNDTFGNTYLSYATLRNFLDGLPCRHIFLVIDACYSGTFDEAIAKSVTYRGVDDVPAPPFVDRIRQFKTRKYLTSAGKERSPDGDEDRQSPFTAKLLEALRTYGGKNGYLTITNIVLHVEGLVPRPVSKEWGQNEVGSDFFFMATKP